MAVRLGGCSCRGAQTQRGARVQIAALLGEPDAMVVGGALCRRRSSVLTGLSRTPSCDGVPRLPVVFWLLVFLPVCSTNTHPVSDCLKSQWLYSSAGRDGRALVGLHRDGAAAALRRPACDGGEGAP